MVAVPVADAAGEPIALLWAFNRSPRPFTGRDEATLTALARQAALAMDNARLVGDLRRTLEELQAAQDTLVRGATLRAVGELAAGAAHHLNNLMAVVLGRSQLLLYRNRDPEMGAALRTIERAALDAADTVRRIQVFSRAGHGASAAPVDLNETVRESIDLTRARWEHEAQVRGARIEMTFEPGALPPVSGRNAELREVLTNLILNAVDALPRGGRLTIRTWSEPGRAVVSVADSGPGMPEETRGRAFEPFFTTKGVRRLGLGLAVAYGLVSSHGGDIALESGEGRGTIVTFWLPAAAATEAGAPARGAADGERHGRILVVDDEADVREVLADVLAVPGPHRHAGRRRPGGAGLSRARPVRPRDHRSRDAGRQRLGRGAGGQERAAGAPGAAADRLGGRGGGGRGPGRRGDQEAVRHDEAGGRGQRGAGAGFSSDVGRDADQDAPLGIERLPDVAAHEQRDQQPVLAAVVGQQRGLQIRAALDPLGPALEGRPVLRPHVHRHPPVVGGSGAP